MGQGPPLRRGSPGAPASISAVNSHAGLRASVSVSVNRWFHVLASPPAALAGPEEVRRRWVIRAMPPRRVSVIANMVGLRRHYHQDGSAPGNAHPRLTTPDPRRERACPARDPAGCDAIDSERRRNGRAEVLDPPYPSRASCRSRTAARPVEAGEVDRKVPLAGRTSWRNSMT
jgi:hypothetical protein